MRTVTPMDQPRERSDDGRSRDRLLGPLAPTPPAPTDRRTLTEEVVVVLMLSLLASAVYAILSLLEAPLAGTVVASANQSTQLTRQLVGFVFGLAPVFLVVHLVRRSGEGLAGIGLAPDRPRADVDEGDHALRGRRARGFRPLPRCRRARREPVRRARTAAGPLVDRAGAAAAPRSRPRWSKR